MADFDYDMDDDDFEKDNSPLKGDDKKKVDELLGEEQIVDDLKLTQSLQMSKLADVNYLKKEEPKEEPIVVPSRIGGRSFAKPNFAKPNQSTAIIGSKPEFSK